MLEGRLIKECDHFRIDVELACEPGRILVLTGPSGSGKTTIIRMLTGLERADEGYLLYHGQAWFDSRKNICIPTRKRRVGYVFQEHSLFPHLNILQNVGFSCPDRGRAAKYLEMMGISHLSSRKVHQVSGGERQRAALAQSLASEPKVLFLDEPFSALDGLTRSRLCCELKKLKSRLHIPIVLVTHNNEEARYLGDKQIALPFRPVEERFVPQGCEPVTLPGPCASHPL